MDSSHLNLPGNTTQELLTILVDSNIISIAAVAQAAVRIWGYSSVG